mmetsp:Transcript_4698/g.6656  ORF Transcript_4698/g.6656 Transcript_4698/m.6656 type:complete len:454 (-) Transcript_4698:236-1597(-)
MAPKPRGKGLESVLSSLLLLLLSQFCLGGEALKRKYILETTHHPKELAGLCDSVNQTAGYLFIEGSHNKNYFYWHFESRSNPEDDPVIVWMTGGPGCSSAVALFHENGPCKINDNHNSTRLNPYSWNSNASIVYIDQPAGVGFSYGNVEDEDYNETMVADDMFHFLHEFFGAHPKLSGNPLYIFGESYGGHFAPSVAHRIGDTLNLKGLGVGNGLTNPEIQYQYYAEMAYTASIEKQGHPVVSKATYHEMKERIPVCVELIKKCQEDEKICMGAQTKCNDDQVAPYEMTGLNPYDFREKCKIPPLCYDFSDVSDFFDEPHVRSALGVGRHLKWQSCNMTVNRMFSSDWMREFQWTIPDLLANGTKVLIYAGDVDFICNWIGNKEWTKALDWPGKAKFNEASDDDWKVDGKSAGKLRSHDGFSFLQIFDAGHMVPLDKPEVALQMVNEFMDGKL